jgi:pimeloyl-ACP methyl ester carboxylesterase
VTPGQSAEPFEQFLAGSGAPVTVFAHGLAGGIADTRPLGSAVAGTRVFFQFRGHGRSVAPAGVWSFDDLAGDLAAVAGQHRATRALGVSLGAGALCRLLARDPTRFERLVFFLPAALDSPPATASRDRFATLLAAIASADVDRIVAVLADDVPARCLDTPAARAYLRERAGALLAHPPAGQLADVLRDPPCPDPAALAAVTAPALVLAARGEPRHPVRVAERLAAALPRATLHVYDQPSPVWTARADLRTRISTFLNTP